MTTTSRFHSGVLDYYDTVTFETVLPLSPITFYEDFLGQAYVAVPVAGSAVDGCPFVAKIVAAAGAPSVAGVANAVGGQVACALAATSEKEDAGLYFGDNLGIDVTKGANFESRCLLSVLPSVAAVQAVWGLASAWIDGPNNNTCSMRFGATGNGAVLIQAFDGTTTTSVATGVTVSTTDWHIYRIDASNLADVRFYIDGAQVSTTGLVNFAATGTLAVLQPYLGCYKASGTGVGTLTIDYVRTWMNRQ
jgi:hypothetical protein